MQIKPKFLKHVQVQPHQVNSYGQTTSGKLYAGKRAITPISPEVDIRNSAQSYKSSRVAVPKAQAQNSKNYVSATSSRLNAHEKLVLLSSNLDDKIRRRRKFLAFMGQIVLWSVVLYVLVLSRVPEIMMLFNR